MQIKITTPVSSSPLPDSGILQGVPSRFTGRGDGGIPGFQDALQAGDHNKGTPDFAEILETIVARAEPAPDHAQPGSADMEAEKTSLTAAHDAVKEAGSHEPAETPVHGREPAGATTESAETPDLLPNDGKARANSVAWPANTKTVENQPTRSQEADAASALPGRSTKETQGRSTGTAIDQTEITSSAFRAGGTTIPQHAVQKESVSRPRFIPQKTSETGTAKISASALLISAENIRQETGEITVSASLQKGSGSTADDDLKLPDPAEFRFETIGQAAKRSSPGSPANAKPDLSGPGERSALETAFSLRAGAAQNVPASERKTKQGQSGAETALKQPDVQRTSDQTMPAFRGDTDGPGQDMIARMASVSQSGETRSDPLMSGSGNRVAQVQRNETAETYRHPDAISDVQLNKPEGKSLHALGGADSADRLTPGANAEQRAAFAPGSVAKAEPGKTPMQATLTETAPLISPGRVARATPEPQRTPVPEPRQMLTVATKESNVWTTPPHDQNSARDLPQKGSVFPHPEKSPVTVYSQTAGSQSGLMPQAPEPNNETRTGKLSSGVGQANIEIVGKIEAGAEVQVSGTAAKGETRAEARISGQAAVAQNASSGGTVSQNGLSAGISTGGQFPQQAPVAPTLPDAGRQFVVDEAGEPFGERFETHGLAGLSSRAETSLATGIKPEAAQQSAAATARAIAAQLQDAAPKVPGKSIEIALNPQELGSVRMAMQMSENTIGISIVAERPETLDLLRRHIDQLAAEFRELGYDQIDLNMADGRMPGQNHNSSNGDSAEMTGPAPGNDDEAPRQERPSKVSMGGVDMRV
jgi:hypothetical protein